MLYSLSNRNLRSPVEVYYKRFNRRRIRIKRFRYSFRSGKASSKKNLHDISRVPYSRGRLGWWDIAAWFESSARSSPRLTRTDVSMMIQPPLDRDSHWSLLTSSSTFLLVSLRLFFGLVGSWSREVSLRILRNHEATRREKESRWKKFCECALWCKCVQTFVCIMLSLLVSSCRGGSHYYEICAHDCYWFGVSSYCSWKKMEEL